MKKNIPNLFTCLNLLCGSVGIILVLQNQDLKSGAYLIWLAGLFDFLDGFAARTLRVKSEIGKELDSLADMVTFGLLPGIIIFAMIQSVSDNSWLPYSGLIIPVFSALRLAKFNIDVRQTDQFIGLPTPANALLISSLPFIISSEKSWLTETLPLPYLLSIISLVFSILMVSEIRLMALKFAGFQWAANKMKYIFILSSITVLILFRVKAFPLVIILYILLSIVNNFLMPDTHNKSN
ncbi:CDP-diacylglycerol--serine O-phosphatidyltransferase [Agaribacillus aureus]|uniref:CDP-diacylglycerol--serine O-phosphatidyltransferase n=1 Tax=Agaribacillus aureus TaxID=3051825 RepID=UPI003211A669